MTGERALAMAAAASGFSAVAFGAFAAHGVETEQAKAWLETGALQQGVHAAAALALLQAPWRGARTGAALLLAAAAIFAGALYALALGAPRGLAALAPLGGTGLLLGWGVVAVAAVRGGSRSKG